MWDALAVDEEEKLQRGEGQRLARRLVRMLRPWWGGIALALLCVAAQVGCLLAGPALVRHGIDSGILEHDADVLNLSAALYVVVALVAFVFGRLAILLTARVGETFLRDLRVRVFRHLLDLGLDYFEREQTGRLIARMTSDMDALQELVQTGITSMTMNALLFGGAVVVIFVLSWQLALCTLVVVPPALFATRWFRRESNRAYLEVRERIGTNLATLQEGLTGVRVVQAFGREQAYTGRFEATNEAQFEANMETIRISTRYFPFMESLGIAATAAIVAIGGYFADQGIASVGTVAAFVLYLNNLFEPIQQLSQQYNIVQSSGAALKKLFGLLDVEPSIVEKPVAHDLPARGAIDVSNVSFAYGTHDVLHGIDLSIAPGERLALVGPTGAGKSTLAKLIVRFYDPREGAISMGGIDLRDATLRSLRERIVVVPQEGFLFSGTVRDNVRVGRPDATDEDIEHAIASLGIADRFRGLPQGLDTEVRERGSRLSGGERQLVSLARAALADPAVLVLDEATSSLDPGTERVVERALERLTQDRTVVVVAHRLSTAARADRVGVVDDGVLAELGSHEELVRAEGRYAALYASWIAAAGAANRAAG
jgi:ATP-binding cassette, subfamily B, bacterial